MKTEGPPLNSDLHLQSGLAKYLMEGWPSALGKLEIKWVKKENKTQAALNSMNVSFLYYMQGVEENFK